MVRQLRQLRFTVRLWRRDRAEDLRWWIARSLPRSIALLAFVRVCAATGADPDTITYTSAYTAWEDGAGR